MGQHILSRFWCDIQDYTKEIGTSASGKSKTIAMTSGNVQVEGTKGVIVGLNVYRRV